jgi:hypothetical protein
MFSLYVQVQLVFIFARSLLLVQVGDGAGQKLRGQTDDDVA